MSTRVATAADLDARHDPGAEVARQRANAADVPHATILHSNSATVRIGVASWTDPTLIESGAFYPPACVSAEARLRYVAERLPLVEVDSTYYALPAPAMAERWVERTPDSFRFNVKAFALMTGQPTEVARLPRAIRDELPHTLAGATRIYPKDLSAELRDEIWRAFHEGVAPLQRSGRLGAVLLQFPRWITPSRASIDFVLDAVERIKPLQCAVELRHNRWFGEEQHRSERTLAFFRERAIPLVTVDGPQGLESSVPALWEATSPAYAMVRLHGRRTATWEAKKIATVERYRWLYTERELEELAPSVHTLASQAAETHVVFNNCYGVYGITNALELTRGLT